MKLNELVPIKTDVGMATRIDADQNAGAEDWQAKCMLCRSRYSRRRSRGYRPAPLPRGQVVKIWEYIYSHNLQNPENRRETLADDKFQRVFGKDKLTMFEMNKHLASHLDNGTGET